MEQFISGGISGAITDPYSVRAREHAKLYYEEIRKNHSDVAKIAENTGYSYDQILMVKNYLFIDIHNLDGEIKQFDPCFEIAESWKRLAFDKERIQPHDLTLLKHEIKERELVISGINQDEAHKIVSLQYNYSKESQEYYKKLNSNIKEKPVERQKKKHYEYDGR